MRIAFLLFFLLGSVGIAQESDSSYPKLIDLDDQAYRQVVVDHEPGQYLGIPRPAFWEMARQCFAFTRKVMGEVPLSTSGVMMEV